MSDVCFWREPTLDSDVPNNGTRIGNILTDRASR
jgi:hypothetical protein